MDPADPNDDASLPKRSLRDAIRERPEAAPARSRGSIAVRRLGFAAISPETPAQRDALAAAAAMFRDRCYAVSDIATVGAPLIEVSEAFETLTGYRPDEALGRSLGFLQHADTDQEGLRTLREAQRAGESCTVVLRAYRRDGSLFWCEQQHFPVPHPTGPVRYYVTLLRDASSRMHQELAAAASRRIAHLGAEPLSSFDYTLLSDDEGEVRLVWVSDAVEAATGLPPAALREGGVAALLHEDDRQRFLRRAERIADDDRRRAGPGDAAEPLHRDRFRVIDVDGSELWMDDLSSVAWRAAGGRRIAIHGRMTRSRVDPSAALGGDRAGDRLTGLPASSLFLDRIQQAMYRSRRSGESLAVALIDLESFDFVAETFGRDAGDDVLRRVAERLRGAMRASDTLARTGSDTFGVLLPGLASSEGALPALEKFVSVIAEPLALGAHEGAAPADPARPSAASLDLAPVVGVAVFPDDTVHVAGELIDRAHIALAAARRRGERYRFYQARLDHQMRERVRVRGDLHRALDTDELVLHYQPRVSLRTGGVTSVEALIRWAHPSRGLLKPAAFLPDAEASRLGQPLFEWVLERGVAQARRWQLRGDPRRVAINVGRQALENDDFCDLVTDAIARHDLHPSLLEIELVEGTSMDELFGASAKLARLRDAGVRVALDDFGVAYASLSQLEALPLDSLKIDRSVVATLRGDDTGRTSLLSAIIAIGRSLDLTIVAEGVETHRQQRLLERLACDEVQGFLHGKALPPDLLDASRDPGHDFGAAEGSD